MKEIFILVGFLLHCNLILLAQTSQPRTLQTKEKSSIHVPPQEAPEGLEKIYSNLGSSKTDLYGESGWTVAGPGSAGGEYGLFVGMPFTPKSDSRVSQVEIAVQYVSGPNQVNLGIYGDSAGVPGTLLAGPVTVTNLPDSGTCCTLAVADFTPLAVAGGTRYWVVADTPLTPPGSYFEGTWATVVKLVDPNAYNYKEEGWKGGKADLLPAGEVLGTIQ